MFGKRKNKTGKFSGITIEKLNNGFLVGMLDQNTNRTVELEESYVFETKEKALSFVQERITKLISQKELNKDNEEEDSYY